MYHSLTPAYRADIR